ncbi:MAG TPA: DUF3142 domain-containing protein [Bryobacteraceae bacterium]|jgi:hypothetical protein
MRLAALLLACLALCGCGGALRSQPPAPKWTTGFWFWQGSSASVSPSAPPVDALYFQAGEIDGGPGQYRQEWSVYANVPGDLPPAAEYWIVLRFNSQSVPDVQVAPLIARRISQLRAEMQQQNRNLAGIQLDIDSPTRALPQYATLLHELRKNLAPGIGISITALLDWFRDGTAIGDVIKEVDEFVPQFYDLNDPHAFRNGIAAEIDSAKWGPAFARFGKRFRIGISTFGRARSLSREDATQNGTSAAIARIYGDLAPVDVASNSAFTLRTSHNDAGELVLTYRATRKVTIGYNQFDPGEGVQFILPTAETVRSAVESAKQIKNCAGVVFFRWPASNETLAMLPEEVLAAANGIVPPSRQDTLELSDGHCAAVHCTDVVLISAKPLQPAALRYHIHSSAELEYFLPEDRIPIHMSGSSDLELSLPPYAGRRRMYLGRAVTLKPAQFTLQPTP